MKKCSKCKRTLDVSMFYMDKSKKEGLHSSCKECSFISHKKYYNKNKKEMNEKRRLYAIKNKEKIQKYKKEHYRRNKDKHKNRDLKNCYGITLNEYKTMVDEQAGKCAICGFAHSKLVVDHDHKSGAVRQLLCNGCNSALGHVKENVTTLASMIDYVKRWNE